MPIFQHHYIDDLTFKRFLQTHQLEGTELLIVQLIAGEKAKANLTDLKKLIKTTLPGALLSEVIVDQGFLGQKWNPKDLWIVISQYENEKERIAPFKYVNASYQALFRESPNLIYIMDKGGRISTCNPAVSSQLGYSESDVIGKPGIHFVKNTDRMSARRHFLWALNGETRTFLIEIRDRNGRYIPYQITNIPIVVDGEVIGIQSIGVNQAAQKEAKTTIERLAYYDPLTGLGNRHLFEKSLKNLTEHAQKHGERLAVIFLDIDRFKNINDTEGHYVGDHILKRVVQRIQGQLYGKQMLYRFEGDKFSILIPQIKSKRTINALIDRIREAFREPIIYKEKEYFLSVSMGVSLFPNNGTNDETLMKNADIALYVAKLGGDNSVVYYQQEMNASFYNRIEFEAYLRKALGKNEFELYYQPQICLKTESIIGCEALIRWNHPKMGIISPAQFIPLAEEIGLIEDIGFWVLRKACQQIKAWQRKGFSPFPVSVNVSVRQFLKKNFVNQVKKIIDSEGIDPKYIHLEITESTTLRDIQYSIELVHELKQIGVCVSLDDFGTGYSALNYLKDFSIDILKIDRSFINNLSPDSQDGAIVKAIIMMSQGLSLRTVAEGVETKQQLNLLKEYGCHAVQGYYYSKPLPSREFENYIKKMANPA
ncbi:sensor domain-containing protein [Tuberibacillus calidus]|uniref:sensor domain-containing protein n=1 Tax=Tuberibacillus calidus TaxID=340097 RepID=UPI0004155FF5|nr:GGDEF domain-containing phosphodiesterase [Tuberibacillus calidus]